jgi:site-specific DNA-methyltransferase (adenine-specific)
MEYLVKLVTPPGGVVLDPFTGSGSTGKAALLNGFKFIGIELTADYLPIIKGRLEFAAQTFQQQAKEKETKESETLF